MKRVLLVVLPRLALNLVVVPLTRRTSLLRASNLGYWRELEPDVVGGIDAVAERGRAIRQALELTHDELRAILVGRGVNIKASWTTERLAEVLADIRLAEEPPRRDQRRRKTIQPLLPKRKPQSFDFIETLTKDVPRITTNLATDVVNGAYNLFNNVVVTAAKEVPKDNSDFIKDLATNTTDVVVDVAKFALGTAQKAVPLALGTAQKVTSTATTTIKNRRRRPWLLNSCLAVADWAAGPFLRREIVLVAAIAAPLLTRSGPFASFLTLISFRLLRDVFGKLDAFLAAQDDDQSPPPLREIPV